MSTQNQTVPRGFAAFGGLAGVATPLLMVAAVVLLIGAGEPEEAGIRARADASTGNFGQLVASSWLFMLTGVGLVLFAAFLAVRWRRVSGWVLPAVAALLAAAAVLFVENLLAIGVFDVLAPAVAEQGSAAGADLVTVGDALDSVVHAGHLLFHLLLGLAVVMAGLALLGGVAAPRWLGYLAVIAGVAMVAYSATQVPPLLMAGSALFAVWAVALGGWSLRSGRAVAVTMAAHD
jgi:hypothetical protein